MTGSVKQFLEQNPVETRRIIERLREVAKNAMPDAKEIMYHGAIGYSPTGAPYDRVVYIMSAESHVTLGFFFGSHLSDPEHLLEGVGKRMRHVKIGTLKDADNPAIKNLLNAAQGDAASSLASLHKKWGLNSRGP
jgi:hypothetical protein